MSFWYKTLGLVCTFSDFMREIERTGQQKVSIFASMYENKNGDDVTQALYRSYVSIEAGNQTVTLRERDLRGRYVLTARESKVELRALKQVIKLGNRLRERSLEVCINNRPIGWAEHDLQEYEERVKKLFGTY